MMMFNEFDVPVSDVDINRLPPGAHKLHERMLAESGIEMNWGWIAGGAALIGGMMSSSKQSSNQQRAADRQAAEQRKAFANQAATNAYNTEFEKLMIEAHNERTVEIYDKQLDMYREQVGLNAESALQAYAQEQRVLNEQYTIHAFGKNKMLRELMEVQGNQLAAGMGNTNRSKERANLINSLGNFGVEQLMLDENLRGVQSAYRQRKGAIQAQWANADRDAFSKIAIAPRLSLPKTGAGPQLQAPGAAPRIGGPGLGSFFSNVSSAITVGTAVASLSDVALKENIKHIGKSPSGINIFEYNYQGETTRHRGAMAQEVLVKKPEAVVEMDNGYLGINYNMIDVKPQVVSTT